jgi:small GTP-binding protein
VWDTAGQERFRTISQTYYQRADGVILAYDCTSQASFASISTWVNQIALHGKENVQKVLVATKCDANRAISREEGEALAERLSIKHIDTSAKENFNIEEVFRQIATQIIKVKPIVETAQPKEQEQPRTFSIKPEPPSAQQPKKKKGGCCK